MLKAFLTKIFTFLFASLFILIEFIPGTSIKGFASHAKQRASLFTENEIKIFDYEMKISNQWMALPDDRFYQPLSEDQFYFLHLDLYHRGFTPQQMANIFAPIIRERAELFYFTPIDGMRMLHQRLPFSSYINIRYRKEGIKTRIQRFYTDQELEVPDPTYYSVGFR